MARQGTTRIGAGRLRRQVEAEVSEVGFLALSGLARPSLGGRKSAGIEESPITLGLGECHSFHKAEPETRARVPSTMNSSTVASIETRFSGSVISVFRRGSGVPSP